MADDSFQEKTEQPTSKRLSEAREKGNVPKSAEFNSVFILLTGILTLYFMSGMFLDKLIYGFKVFYREVGNISINSSSIQYYLAVGGKASLLLFAPMLGLLAVIAIAVNLAQTGPLFSMKILTPDFGRLNPIKGVKKFFSLRALVDLVKNLLKVAIISVVAYNTIIKYREEYLLTINESVPEIVAFIGLMMFRVAIRTAVVLFFLAILDLIYQRWQHRKDLMMTKQEVQEERKQQEGSQQVKSAMRSLQLSRARERMMQRVAQADVVITNPTELAIALKYDPEEMNAPVVLAKGARLLAQRIRELARENGIPIYENKPLARSLYKLAEVGKEIPIELFHAVAEVFAYVYRLKNKHL
ncbi:MAG: flagellar biosynthesis protein FlhB [Calditrichaeota bacterium]|nr:MAG: flagellar biosynthesis protein FlhB [Calditrichota bacterium]